MIYVVLSVIVAVAFLGTYLILRFRYDDAMYILVVLWISMFAMIFLVVPLVVEMLEAPAIH